MTMDSKKIGTERDVIKTFLFSVSYFCFVFSVSYFLFYVLCFFFCFAINQIDQSIDIFLIN